LLSTWRRNNAPPSLESVPPEKSATTWRNPKSGKSIACALQSVVEEAVSRVFIWLNDLKPSDALAASLFNPFGGVEEWRGGV
jgi:hypothetical protein